MRTVVDRTRDSRRSGALAWSLAAAVPATVVVVGVLLTYGLVLEYGGDVRSVAIDAVVTAAFAGVSAVLVVRAIRSRRSARTSAVIPVLATAAAAAVITLVAGWAAQRQFAAETLARDTACTQDRVAELLALDLPGRAEPPAGRRDGRCMATPVVPASREQAQGVLRTALAAHGWTPDGSADGHPRYRKAS